ncbi:hypothetical protein [Burkholderia cepacia]|uniref:hypothetical protein n=1 Tax=Burkholderia cepacia TaxID=292 RepID=UPI0012D88226|nr:hypothetical protein [Burkholderia cepacia]
MNKKIYKAVVTIDTGGGKRVIADELRLPKECEKLLDVIRKYERKQCMRISRALFDDYCNFTSKQVELILAFQEVFTLALDNPLATFEIRTAD